MDEDHPPRKKSWAQRLRMRNRSDNNLSGQRSSTMPSTGQPSHNPFRPGSNKGRSGLFRNIFETRNTRSAGQSPHPAPSSIARNHSSDHQNQDPSPLTVPASDANIVQGTNSEDAKVEQPDHKKAIEDARIALTGIKNFPGVVRGIPSATDKGQSALDAVDKTISPIIAPLKVFNSLVNGISEIHPYAKAVLSIFAGASKMILDQQSRDNAVQDLLKKLSEVYTFMNEDVRLADIVSMQELYGKAARQTLECADFIVHYSEAKSAWRRLARDVFRETSALIKSYNDVLDALMQQFRDGAVRDIVVNVHRLAEDLDLKDMDYAKGAGRQTSKRCLPGTREAILNEIKTWIDSTGEDAERVFWLNGTAGKGKSAIVTLC